MLYKTNVSFNRVKTVFKWAIPRSSFFGFIPESNLNSQTFNLDYFSLELPQWALLESSLSSTINSGYFLFLQSLSNLQGTFFSSGYIIKNVLVNSFMLDFKCFFFFLNDSSSMLSSQVIVNEPFLWQKSALVCILLFAVGVSGILRGNESNDVVNILIYLELLLLSIFLIFLLSSFFLNSFDLFSYLAALAILVNAAAESVVGCCLLIQNFFVVGFILWARFKSRR